MQKRYLFSLLFLTVSFHILSAQCPGCGINLPELPEDTVYLSNPITGQVGVYYDDDLSFRLPKTTATVDPSIQPPVNISSITITSVSGLPPGLSWEASQLEYSTETETDGCVKFCGTPLVADSFYVNVTVDAQVSIFTQTTSFPIPFLIEPAGIDTEGFSMTNNIACGSSTVEFSNNIASNGAEGVDYFWDFGNGTTSSLENPNAVTFDQPGTYNVAYQAVIDTTGYFLTEVNIEESDCDDFIGTADFYLVISDPTGNVIYTSETISSDPPLSFDLPSIALEGGNYTIQVFDSDPVTQVNCGSVNFTFATEGSLFDEDLELTMGIINPITTISSTGEVVIYALPETPIISPATVEGICSGTTVELSVGEFDNIQWYQDTSLLIGEISNTLNVENSGTYSVVYTSAEGCMSSSAPTLVSFDQTPSSPVFSFNENELAVVNPENLPAAYTLQWFFEGQPIVGETNLIICMEETGDYALEVTDTENGCINTYEQYQVFFPGIGCAMTSTNDLNISTLGVFPNPASAYIILELPANTSGDLSVFDSRGVRVFTGRISDQNTLELDISSFVNGIYLIKIESSESFFSGRFVKS